MNLKCCFFVALKYSMPEITPSLEDINKSVDTTNKKGLIGKLLAFMGPAYLISVGYMDPGNWATDIAGGAQFGYKLIWVLCVTAIWPKPVERNFQSL
jgi:manganese transport protein